MVTAQSIMDELKSKGNEKTRAIYGRHGVPVERTFGVSNADLKTIAKTIKKQQALAYDLYATGNMDAMYLAGIVADGKQFTEKELRSWAMNAGMPIIAEYTVPWVAIENASGHNLALEWIESDDESVASAGWCTLSGMVTTLPDSALDMAEIEGLLQFIVVNIGAAKNRVRACMNGYVIAVGTYVKPLHEQAKTAAEQMGVVLVDVGDTACCVRVATEHIAKAENANKVGLKRKTIRC